MKGLRGNFYGRKLGPRFWALATLMGALLALSVAAMSMRASGVSVSVQKEPPMQLGEGEGTSRCYWDTANFDGLDYAVTYGDIDADYHVYRKDGALYYERACRKSGEVVFEYASYLKAEDYRSMTEMLWGLSSKDEPGESWQLSYRMGGQERVLSGDETDPNHDDVLWDLMGWMNRFEADHGNLSASIRD